MTRKPKLRTKHMAEHMLKLAVRARDIHAGECLEWDYENPDACPDCVDLDVRVRRARAVLAKLEVGQ